MRPTEYEREVNQFIPDAMECADKQTVKRYPQRGPRIIGSSRGTGVRLSIMKMSTRKEYEIVTDFWNKVFHQEMNRLTRAAGVRWI